MTEKVILLSKKMKKKITLKLLKKNVLMIIKKNSTYKQIFSAAKEAFKKDNLMFLTERMRNEDDMNADKKKKKKQKKRKEKSRLKNDYE